MLEYLISLPERLLKVILSVLFLLFAIIISIPANLLYHNHYQGYIEEAYKTYIKTISDYKGKKWIWQ